MAFQPASSELSSLSERYERSLQAVIEVAAGRQRRLDCCTYYLLTILRLIYEGVQRKIETFDPACDGYFRAVRFWSRALSLSRQEIGPCGKMSSSYAGRNSC